MSVHFWVGAIACTIPIWLYMAITAIVDVPRRISSRSRQRFTGHLIRTGQTSMGPIATLDEYNRWVKEGRP